AGSRALPADRAAPHRARRRDRCGHAVGGPVARAPHAIGPPLRRPHPRPLSFARRGEWPSPPAPLLPGSGLNGLPGTPLNGSRLCLATPLRLAIHAAEEGRDLTPGPHPGLRPPLPRSWEGESLPPRFLGSALSPLIPGPSPSKGEGGSKAGSPPSLARNERVGSLGEGCCQVSLGGGKGRNLADPSSGPNHGRPDPGNGGRGGLGYPFSASAPPTISEISRVMPA